MRKVAFRLSLLLLFVIPWENALLVSGVGTISRLIGLSLIGAWAIDHLVRRHFRPLKRFHLLMLAFFGWAALSTVWSLDTDASISKSGTHWQLALLVIVLWDLYPSRTQLLAGVQAFVLGSYVSLISIILNTLRAGPQDRTYIRGSAEGFNPNDIAMILLIAVALAWYLVNQRDSESQNPTLRLLNYGMVAGGFVGIALTGSRSAILGLVPIAAYIVLGLRRIPRSRKVALLITAVFAVILMQQVIPASTFSRFVNAVEDSTASDLGGRLEIWDEGLNLIEERPLLGVGAGAFKTASGSGIGAHNTVLLVMAENGIVGLLLYGGVFLSAVAAASRVRRFDSAVWLAILWSWALGAQFHTWETRKFSWFILSFALIAQYQRGEAIPSVRRARFSRPGV